MDEFYAHWDDVNIFLGGTAATDLKLQGLYTRAMFFADRNAIDAAITALVGLENSREVAANNRDLLKQGLAARLNSFRGILRALFPNSIYAGAAPLVPVFSSVESRFLTAFDDMSNLWAKINADATLPGFTPPLVIAGITLAQFQTELAAMRTVFTAVTVAENDERIGRQNRDALLDPARERMIQYRALVEAVLGPTHPLTLSLPALSPSPGSTPAAVTLSGSWNAGLSMAVFNWTASTAASLAEYELRMSPGATYDAATATVVGNAAPGTLTLQTTTGSLSSSGDVASFKLFVKLTTGNESGSNTVTITRP
jgi:hypothetical protein